MACRGFRNDGSILRRHPSCSNISEAQVAGEVSGRADGAGEAGADYFPLERGGV